MKLIRFKPDGSERWQIAFSYEHLCQQLDGKSALIQMPAKHLFVRLWRKLFPLRYQTFPADGVVREARLR